LIAPIWSVENSHLLPFAPPAAWDGWFAIAIPARGSGLRWCKAHFYNLSARTGAYPFSLLEALGKRTEVMIAWADENEVHVHDVGVDGGALACFSSPLAIAYEDNFLFEGGAGRYEMSFALPGKRRTANFRFEAGWPIWWSRFGRMLQYVGLHSRVSMELADEGLLRPLDCFGVMEHVTGAAAPFDISRAPVSYHWDVLAFDGATSPFDSAAGLSIGFGGGTAIPLKAAACLPGSHPAGMRGLWVTYREVTEGEDAEGNPIMVPVRWEGVMRSRKGTLRYQAKAATPAACILPGGAMLGFDFECAWRSAGAVKTFTGTGFTEYGDFTGRLKGTGRRLTTIDEEKAAAEVRRLARLTAGGANGAGGAHGS